MIQDQKWIRHTVRWFVFDMCAEWYGAIVWWNCVVSVKMHRFDPRQYCMFLHDNQYESKEISQGCSRRFGSKLSSKFILVKLDISSNVAHLLFHIIQNAYSQKFPVSWQIFCPSPINSILEILNVGVNLTHPSRWENWILKFSMFKLEYFILYTWLTLIRSDESSSLQTVL